MVPTRWSKILVMVIVGFGTVVTPVSAQSSCPTGQFQAEYFNNPWMSRPPMFTRCESAPVSASWSSQSGPGNGIGSDRFLARRNGVCSFSAATYTFSATADYGIRVWVDGAVVIDQWRDQGAGTFTAQKALSAGNHAIG